MKRSERDHGHSTIKRIKSLEDCFEECPKQGESKTTHRTGKCGSKLPPGFGFGADTDNFYRGKDTRRTNGKRGCKKRIMTKGRKKTLHLDLPGEADRSLETDTLDITTDNNVEKGDQTDNAGPNVEQINALQIPIGRLAQTYPPSRKSSRNNLEGDDLEIDLIIPEQIRERQLACPPSNVSQDYSDMIAKDINEPLVRLNCIRVDILVQKQRPEHESTVQIHHIHKGLTLHDDFGARLKTYKTKTHDGKEYYRHIFYDVEKGATAEEMNLRNNNEIVLLNGVFVPDLTHHQVIDLFRDVKVDGETRFQLVVRYVNKKVWMWFQTSAILSPEDHHRGRGDKHPSVEDEHFRVLPDNETEMESTCRFRVKGTKYFVVIKDDQVGVSVEPYDIRITDRYKQDKTGNVIFTASLRAYGTNNYIAVSGKNIIIEHTPFWFHMSQISADYAFTCDDKYLAFDARKKRLTTAAGKTQYMFQKIPLDGEGLDEIDAAVAGPSTSDTAEHIEADEDTVPVPGHSACDTAEQMELDEHSANDMDTVNQHSKLVLTSSKNTDASSSPEFCYPMSQCSSLSDIEYADACDTSESMTSSSQSSQDDMGLESSGYLTSGSLDLSNTHDISLSLFEDKPKTPNTPMACLSMNDTLKNKLTS